ncbi:MAG: methylenetetrahydrofolate reductase [NAD(P)H], partial [Planctomycetaceae bacterium]
MRISEILNKGFCLSIEIFPPKTEAGERALLKHMQRLTEYQPAFFSCTYGAGGSTQAKTYDWCRRIQDDLNQTATAHFTCVGSTKEELLAWLSKAAEAGVHNIMALRGDPPDGQTEFKPVDGGLAYADELVAFIREHFPNFGIGVGGYPEKHPEAPDIQTDLTNLKRKVDAGADAIYTQLFYVNDSFLKWRDQCVAQGIETPIVPGIMPITEFARIKRITSLCGSEFPSELAQRLEAVQDDTEAQFEIGVEFAIEQCRELIAAGVPGIHFYVLNKSRAAERILDALQLS